MMDMIADNTLELKAQLQEVIVTLLPPWLLSSAPSAVVRPIDLHPEIDATSGWNKDQSNIITLHRNIEKLLCFHISNERNTLYNIQTRSIQHVFPRPQRFFS